MTRDFLVLSSKNKITIVMMYDIAILIYSGTGRFAYSFHKNSDIRQEVYFLKIYLLYDSFKIYFVSL